MLFSFLQHWGGREEGRETDRVLPNMRLRQVKASEVPSKRPANPHPGCAWAPRRLGAEGWGYSIEFSPFIEHLPRAGSSPVEGWGYRKESLKGRHTWGYLQHSCAQSLLSLWSLFPSWEQLEGPRLGTVAQRIFAKPSGHFYVTTWPGCSAPLSCCSFLLS